MSHDDAPSVARLAALVGVEISAARKRIPPRHDERLHRDSRDPEGRALYEQCVRIPDPDLAYRAVSSVEWTGTRVALDWLRRSTRPHLLLRGACGTGKSVAAAVVAREWTRTRRKKTGEIIAGNPVSWLFPDELVSAVFHQYDQHSPKLERHIVIDEMGTERKPEFAAALCQLLNMPRLRIVITSNGDRADFRARYTDPRLISRMNADFFTATVTGDSRRPTDGGVF